MARKLTIGPKDSRKLKSSCTCRAADMPQEVLYKRFINSSESSTVVLIDMDFLYKEFHRIRLFYARYYNVNNLRTHIDELTLIDSICRQIRLNKQLSSFYAFHLSTKITDLFSTRQYKHIEFVRCRELPCFAMDDVVNSLPTVGRVVLVADQMQYPAFLYDLVDSGYAVGVLKHRQENDMDWSVMPYNLPYQYVDFVIADCLGVAP